MVKTIQVSDDTWKELLYFKTDNNLKSMDEAIANLLMKGKEEVKAKEEDSHGKG